MVKVEVTDDDAIEFAQWYEERDKRYHLKGVERILDDVYSQIGLQLIIKAKGTVNAKTSK